MKENSIEKDIEIVENLLSNAHVDYEEYYQQIEIGDISFHAIKNLLSNYKKVLKEAKRYKNMYEAEHQIHLVRNEQLDRKQKAIIKCNELENENKELKKENEEKTTIILAGAEKVKQLEKENEKQSELIEKVNQYLFNKDMMRDFLKGDKQNERGRKESY